MHSHLKFSQNIFSHKTFSASDQNLRNFGSTLNQFFLINLVYASTLLQTMNKRNMYFYVMPKDDILVYCLKGEGVANLC